MIDRSTSIRRALRQRQGGFIINPFRFGGGGGGGSDPDFASVVALLHFEGSNGSTTFTDQKGKTWTPTGDAQLTTTSPIIGSSSLLLDGNGDWVTCASDADFAFGTGDFTIECFVNTPGTGTQYVFSFGPNWIVYFASNQIYFNINGVNRITSTTITRGVDRHLALTRASNVVRLFYNGALLGSWTDSPTNITAADFNLGRYPLDASFRFNGRIDELRITKGVARYTAAFTPPTTAFPDS